MIARFLKRFAWARSGSAAVEFALIAPILATITTVGWSMWWGQTAIEQAKTALRAGAEYYNAGGTSDNTATLVVLSAWQPKPSNPQVTANRACYCNGVTISCATACAVGQQRTIYVTLGMSWTGQGAFANQTQTQQEVLRVE
jgi:Flp pilus assembly protein TadG